MENNQNFLQKFRFCPACGSENFCENSPKSKRCNECGFEFFQNPAAAVAAFIRNEKGELLVCRRAKNPFKGTLDLPGGFCDENENLEQALAREIREELGVSVAQTRYLFSLPNIYNYSNLNIPTLDSFFETTISSENLAPADDVAQAFFLPIDEIDPELFGLSSISLAVKRYKENLK